MLWSEVAKEGQRRIQPLRDITPNSGAYLNEADYYEPNWPKSLFGDNYERLKSIKEEYDPNGLFRVWNGIGGTRSEDNNASSLLMSVVAIIATAITFSA